MGDGEVQKLVGGRQKISFSLSQEQLQFLNWVIDADFASATDAKSLIAVSCSRFRLRFQRKA